MSRRPRILKEDVYASFRALCDKIGQQVFERDAAPGSWKLDYTLGGWVIKKKEEGKGNWSLPFGSEIRSSREMKQTLDFVINLVDHIRLSHMIDKEIMSVREELRRIEKGIEHREVGSARDRGDQNAAH